MALLYEHLPDTIRQSVDELVEELHKEDWPTRFLALIGLLGEKLKERTDPDPALLLQQWAGLVTAIMEKLPSDIHVMECAALMSLSYNDAWRTQVLARLDRGSGVHGHHDGNLSRMAYHRPKPCRSGKAPSNPALKAGSKPGILGRSILRVVRR